MERRGWRSVAWAWASYNSATYHWTRPLAPDKTWEATLNAGVNFFDTAECYRNSEALIGKTVVHRHSEFVLATKAGHAVDEDFRRVPSENCTAETVRDSIDRSLVRLKTDYVDLFQFHADDISAPPPDDVLQAVMDAKDTGKTRLLGYSGEN